MEIIRHTLNEEVYIPEALIDQMLDKKICFLDIETTGFSRKYNHIILIGLLYINNSKIEVIQFLADNEKDEKNIINDFVKYIPQFEVIFNFNGDAFDIPFINARLKYYNYDYEIDKSLSMDIFKVVRNKKKILGLDKYNLKTIEKLLRISREDTISGKKSVELYFEYTKTKNNRIKDIILKHNYEDIYNLPKILKIFDIIEDKSKIILKTRYLNTNIEITIKIDSIKRTGNMMYVEGLTNTINLPDEMHYGDTHTINWYPQTGNLQISLEVEDGNLSDGSKCVFFNSIAFRQGLDNINRMNYKLPDNILMLSHNGNIIADNVEVLIKHLWQGLNKN
ncbi:MAG: ribonuclease H-like domain-containing protein [Tissierellales bacterium]